MDGLPPLEKCESIRKALKRGQVRCTQVKDVVSIMTGIGGLKLISVG